MGFVFNSNTRDAINQPECIRTLYLLLGNKHQLGFDVLYVRTVLCKRIRLNVIYCQTPYTSSVSIQSGTPTSTLFRVVFSKSLILGSVGIQVEQRVFWDVFSFQDLEISNDFMEGDLGKVDFGEGLDCLYIRLT